MSATIFLPLVEPLSTLTNAGVIGAWMLYPDDEAQRERLMVHFAIKDRLRELLGQTGRIDVDAKLLAHFVSQALEAPSPAEVEKMTERRAKHGVAAGGVLYNALPAVAKKERSPLAHAKKRAHLASGRTNSSPSHMNDLWSRFVPVCAFWAAWMHLDDGGASSAPFPCAPEALAEFLSLSEEFRTMGEEAVPPNRRDPVVPPGRHVRLPQWVEQLPLKGQLTIVG